MALETERLAYFAVFDILKNGSYSSSAINDQKPCFFRQTTTEQCLQACVLKMLDRHSIVFNGMMNRLHVDRSVDFRQGFNEIAQELFKDDVTWSKIVAFFAFGAKLGQYCRDHELEDMIEDVAANMAAFANQIITPFVRTEGGWKKLCKVFPPEEDYESQIWKGLVLVGVGLTAATLIMLTRR